MNLILKKQFTINKLSSLWSTFWWNGATNTRKRFLAWQTASFSDLKKRKIIIITCFEDSLTLIYPGDPFWGCSVSIWINHMKVKNILYQGKSYIIAKRNVYALFRNKWKYNYTNHMQVWLMRLMSKLNILLC